MIPGIRADRTLGVPGPLPAGRTGGRQGPRVGAGRTVSTPSGRHMSEQRSDLRHKHWVQAWHGSTTWHGSGHQHWSQGHRALLWSCTCADLPRAQPRSLRFHRKGAVAPLGRQMALRPQAWRFVGSADRSRRGAGDAVGRGGAGDAGAGGPAGGSRHSAAADGGDPGWPSCPDRLLSGAAPSQVFV